jgi:hypothetical protein
MEEMENCASGGRERFPILILGDKRGRRKQNRERRSKKEGIDAEMNMMDTN